MSAKSNIKIQPGQIWINQFGRKYIIGERSGKDWIMSGWEGERLYKASVEILEENLNSMWKLSETCTVKEIMAKYEV